jgi:Uma2 family endonuclease
MKTTEKKQQDPKKKKYKIEIESPEAAEQALVYGVKRYSYADYLTWNDDVMREIIDGIVYAFSAPVRKHAAAVSTFFGRVFNFIDKRKETGKCKIYTAPFDVRLPIDGETDDDKIYNVVQPDILVVCDPTKLDDKGCVGAPDLVVEVASPSTSKREHNQKFFLYEKAGVKEYWVVYPNDKAVTVFILKPNGKYDEGKTYEVVYGTTKVPVKTLKGLIIDLEELFSD